MSKRTVGVVMGWALLASAGAPAWAGAMADTSVASGWADAGAEDKTASKEDEAYDRGTHALDEEHWDRAIEAFDSVVRMAGRKADAGLYWKAYALNKAGRAADALATIAQLRKSAPQSRWLNDARALEMEIRQRSGQRTSPETEGDEDLKLMALNGLLNADPERALPLLEKFMSGNDRSSKLRERALFVLSQSDSPRAREIVVRIARGQQSPDMQEEAIRYLGLFGGDASKQALADLYASSSDTSVKKAVLQSFMVSGQKARVLAAARGEKSEELRKTAIHLLGVMGAQTELWDMYQAESSVEVKKSILHAMFVGGGSERLTEVARGEKDPELRKAAIHSLGVMGDRTGPVLLSIYASDPDRDVRRQILHALFVQGNVKALIQIARTEKDTDLRKEAVGQLSHMGSKEATDFLLELLNK
ncbi:MAG TPA: HEAT repeat domain-containing protein [Vicinamibacteria bacterium]